jgi:glycosyltransferase-like protein
MTSVGLFTYSTKPRGSVVHAAALAEALARAGADVTLYALGKGGASFYRPIACRVRVFPAAEAPQDVEALIRQRMGELARGFRASGARHDILHAEDCLAANALLSDRAGGAAVVRTVHHVERFANPYLAACQRRSILEADAVFSVSRSTQREVLREFGRASSLVHNGVDLGRFAGAPSRDRAWLRALHGIPEDHALVLSVGGVEPRKNTRMALAAAARAFARFERASWLIVGGESFWDHSDYARAFAADLAKIEPAIARRVTVVGPLPEDELTALYRTAAVLLCPSEHEGFGLCVLEAMAAGVPAIVPGRPPFTEFADAGTAALVDPASIEDVAGTLAHLLADPALRASLGAAARVRARRFTWERSAEMHRRLYDEVRGRAERAAKAFAIEEANRA